MTDQNAPDTPEMDPLIAQPAPASAPPDIPRPPVHSGSRRRVRTRERIRYSRPRSLWIGILLFLIGIETAVLLAIHANINMEKTEQQTLNATLKNGDKEIKELNAQVVEMTELIAKQVYARLPGLRPLAFDRVIPIDAGQVKNIMFTQSGIGDEQSTEYRVVLYNPGSATTRAHMEIMLFNQAGVQSGRADVGGNELGPAPIVLDPGEIRSYSDKIGLETGQNAPFYFMLRERPAGK